MIKDILKIIYESRVYSKSYIAKELNISMNMVEIAIEQLLNMGLLQEDLSSNTCTGSCSGCSISNCSKELVKTYTVTDKGLNTLAA